MTTQTQVNAAIDHLLNAAEPFEVARDRAVWESSEYWANHDSAMNLILTAENLMPRKIRRQRPIL